MSALRSTPCFLAPLESNMSKVNYFKSSRGATLVESVVAIGLAAVVVTAIVGSVVTSLASSTSAKSRTTATRYAEEGIESARLTRDSLSWSSFFGLVNSSVYHVGSDFKLTTSTDTNISSLYTRAISLANISNPPGSNDKVQVTVTVTWNDRGKTETVTLVSYLTKWAP